MSDNGSEKKNTEQVEEQEVKGEAEAAGEVEAVVQAKEQAESGERPEAPQHPAPKKGLMERRASFSQASVPNAHRGYDGRPPVVMLGIIFILFIASCLLAAIST